MPYVFAHPGRLWLLAALVPLIGWVIRGARRRDRDWVALGQSAGPPGAGAWGWVVATALLVVALAEPRWGRGPGPDLPAGHDVVLLVDVSRSMAAEDAVPDRLGLAIESGVSLLQALGQEPGQRSAVVAFAGRGVVRCPLTADLDAAAEALQALRPGAIHPGGTDLGAALDAAISAFDEEEHADGRTIVVFSDGEDHVGSWPSAIDRLRTAGIIVHSVAIGDPDHAHPIARPGRDGSDQDRAPPVESRRSDAAFEALSRATGGAMVPLGRASADLGALYRDRIEPTARRRHADFRPPERIERFPVFVVAAIIAGLAGSWPGFSRSRGRRLAIAIPAIAVLSIGAVPAGMTPATLVAEGNAAYDAGRFAEARDAFERAVALAPDAAIPRYDAAAASFQLRRYPEAILRYAEARLRADRGLATKIDYAMGNAHLALGDFPQALAHFDDCLASTWPGATFDAIRRDAAANRAYAASRIKPPPPETGEDRSKPPGPDRSRPPRKRGPGDPKGADLSSTGGTSDPRRDGGPSSPPGARGAGGAGGSGPAPEASGSPESRLDAALRDVREARRLRPPDPAPARSSGVVKDW